MAEINEKKRVKPEIKRVSKGFIMACVDQTNIIGGTKYYRFKKINAWNGARTVGDWELTPRSYQVVKFNINYYLLAEDKIKGSRWADEHL